MLTPAAHSRFKLSGKLKCALVVALLCSCFAASAPGLTYRGFSDITEVDWFYPYVIHMNEAGLVPRGMNQTFLPDATTTTAEFAYVLLEAQNQWVRSAMVGEDWTSPYLEHISAVLGHEVTLEPMTRTAAASMLVSVLDLPAPETDSSSPFADTADFAAISVFDAGLMDGTLKDGERVFCGEDPLTHAELAVLSTRLMRFLDCPGKEESEETNSVYDRLSYKGVCIPESTPLPESPTTTAGFRQVLEYMVVNNQDSVNLIYQDLTPNAIDDLKELLQSAYRQFRYERSEYCSYFDRASIQVSTHSDRGTALQFLMHAPHDQLEQANMYRTAAFSRASDVLENLYACGELNAEMTERERALVLTDWVCSHTSYMNNEERLDHTAWSVFQNGTAVCDGFASALQILLSLDNIQCWGQAGHVKSTGEPHQWTIAVLDGEVLGIDPTFYQARHTYFGMSKDIMDRRYTFQL